MGVKKFIYRKMMPVFYVLLCFFYFTKAKTFSSSWKHLFTVHSKLFRFTSIRMQILFTRLHHLNRKFSLKCRQTQLMLIDAITDEFWISLICEINFDYEKPFNSLNSILHLEILMPKLLKSFAEKSLINLQEKFKRH